MPRAIERDPMYHRRRFSVEIIELCVHRHITYRLSHRDLVAMMADRCVAAGAIDLTHRIACYPKWDRHQASSSPRPPEQLASPMSAVLSRRRASMPATTPQAVQP